MNVRDDDVMALLIEGDSAPEGNYQHALWELRTNGKAVSNEALIVSVHEMLHHLLNNTTAYGLALMVVAHLARHSDDFISNRNTLVRNCRTAHEVFATYVSLLLVSREHLQANRLKEIYPGYERYVLEAEMLVRGMNQYRHQHAILNGSIRVCFQSPELLRNLNGGRPFDVTESPNDRLNVIQSVVDDEFWVGRLSLFHERNRGVSGIDEYVGDETDSVVVDSVGAQQFDVLSRLLDSFVYEQLREILPAYGIEVLPTDEHLEYLQQLVSFVSSMEAFHDDDFPLAVREKSGEDPPLVEFENERIVLRKNKISAVVVPFRNVDRSSWQALRTHLGDRSYIYVVSRITERALESYALNDQDRKWLVERYPDFFTAVVARQTTEQGVQLLFAVLDDPKQITELSSAGMGILSSSSLLLTADSRWERWHETLDSYSSHTTVFDLTPSSQLFRVAECFDSISYRKLHIESADGETYSFMLLVGRGEVPTGVYFLVCGEVMSSLAIDYLTEICPTAKPLDDSLEQNKEMFWLAQAAVAHLVEESQFDFRAINSAYATRGFQAGHFRNET